MIGVAVLVVAVVALRHPKNASTNAGSDTRTVTPSSTASLTGSPSGSRSKSTSSTRTGTSGSSSRTSSSHTEPTAIGSLPLIVLNDTHTSNLAHDAAIRFEGGGWNVTSYDEGYSNNILSTAAYYDPDVSGAKRAALALQKQYPTIKRVVPKFTGLPKGPVVVVLTTDYSPG